jgi:hypothetical protein
MAQRTLGVPDFDRVSAGQDHIERARSVDAFRSVELYIVSATG